MLSVPEVLYKHEHALPTPFAATQHAGMLSIAPDTQSSPPHADSALPHNWMDVKSYVNKQYLALCSCSRHYKHELVKPREPPTQ